MNMQVCINFQHFEARHQFSGCFEDLNFKYRCFQKQLEEQLDILNPVVDLIQSAYTSSVILKIWPCS